MPSDSLLSRKHLVFVSIIVIGALLAVNKTVNPNISGKSVDGSFSDGGRRETLMITDYDEEVDNQDDLWDPATGAESAEPGGIHTSQVRIRGALIKREMGERDLRQRRNIFRMRRGRDQVQRSSSSKSKSRMDSKSSTNSARQSKVSQPSSSSRSSRTRLPFYSFTRFPTIMPETLSPTNQAPTVKPTFKPTNPQQPSKSPQPTTSSPTKKPSPTAKPTSSSPTKNPGPTAKPTSSSPTKNPGPTAKPTSSSPTKNPGPTPKPTSSSPTKNPGPTAKPTATSPTKNPTPTAKPTVSGPSKSPTPKPTTANNRNGALELGKAFESHSSSSDKYYDDTAYPTFASSDLRPEEPSIKPSTFISPSFMPSSSSRPSTTPSIVLPTESPSSSNIPSDSPSLVPSITPSISKIPTTPEPTRVIEGAQKLLIAMNELIDKTNQFISDSTSTSSPTSPSSELAIALSTLSQPTVVLRDVEDLYHDFEKLKERKNQRQHPPGRPAE